VTTPRLELAITADCAAIAAAGAAGVHLALTQLAEQIAAGTWELAVAKLKQAPLELSADTLASLAEAMRPSVSVQPSIVVQPAPVTVHQQAAPAPSAMRAVQNDDGSVTLTPV